MKINWTLLLKKLLLIVSLIILNSCHTRINKQKTIGLQIYEKFNPLLLDTLKKSIKNIYGFNVQELNSKDIPQRAFVNIKTPRYRADTIIRLQQREIPEGIDIILGLTEKDISTTKWDYSTSPKSVKRPKNGKTYEDWGIFGLGYTPGNSCIVSTFRIKNKKNEMDRFNKICIHEIGHNLGLKHCKENSQCVMRDAAESILTIDGVDLDLCDKCIKKLKLEHKN